MLSIPLSREVDNILRYGMTGDSFGLDGVVRLFYKLRQVSLSCVESSQILLDG